MIGNIFVCDVCITIDVGERDWKRKWASENIRASLSCLLFLPQMRKTKLLITVKNGERDTINSALVHDNSKENMQRL